MAGPLDGKPRPFPPITTASSSMPASSHQAGATTATASSTTRPPITTTHTPSSRPTAAAADGKSPPPQAFWSSLKIEIEPPYEGKPPEWHTEQSDSMSIPAQISSSPSDTDTGLSHMGISGESFQGLPHKAEPPVAKRITTCLSCALVALGATQLSLQMALFAQLRHVSSWWSGAFSMLVGALGLLGRWECARITHRTFALMGILLNAIAAVLDARTETILQDPGLFCGPPAQGIGDTSVQEWCEMSPRTLDVLTCGCIVPGSDPGSKASCVALHGRSSDCYGSAFYLRNLLGVSVALCWALAVVCCVSCLARLVFTCYKRRQCPARLTSLCSLRAVLGARRHGQTREIKRQHPAAVGALDSQGSSSFGSLGEEGQGEKEKKSILGDPRYFLRDGPAVGPTAFRVSPSFPSSSAPRRGQEADEEEGPDILMSDRVCTFR